MTNTVFWMLISFSLIMFLFFGRAFTQKNIAPDLVNVSTGILFVNIVYSVLFILIHLLQGIVHVNIG